MLRITTIKSGTAAIRYFEKSLIQQDYYSKDSKILGTWGGKLAKEMDIEGYVSKDQYRNIVNNLHPVTGVKLTARTKSNRRSGYDFTINASKSVSLVYAITGDEEILFAHQEAIKTVMIEVEKNIQTQEGQGKNKHYNTTGNLLYAAFDHFTARPETIKGKMISDPHLHTHVVVQNVTWNKDKNRYQAIEISTIKKEAEYYQMLYHSHFGKLLQEKGYKIIPKGNSFEIERIERKTIEKFSNRSNRINDIAVKRNIVDPKIKDKLGGLTRLSKNKSIPDEDLYQHWINRLTPEEMEVILNAKSKAKDVKPKATKEEISNAIDLSLEHHMERKSVVNEKLVLGYALKQLNFKSSIDELKTQFDERKDIIKVRQYNSEYITTHEMINNEIKVLDYAVNERNKYAAINAAYKIENSLLNKDQIAAVQHVLKSEDGVILISGDAGTGKTTLMLEVKSGIEKTGKKLFAFAPSADASRGELVDKGFQNATTIEAMLQNEKLQQTMRDQIILIDEAAMIGTKTTLKVFEVAQKQNIRVILSGDFRQIKAVEAGDSMKVLEQKTKLPIQRVKENIRQRSSPQLQNVVKLLAKGDTARAIDVLDKTGRIKEITDKEKRNSTIAKDYVEFMRQGKSVMFVSPTHLEGKAVSEKIREELKKHKLIIGNENTYQTRKSLSYTTAEKKDYKNYDQGFMIEFHKRTSGFRSGTPYNVSNIKNGEVFIKSEKGKPVLLPKELAGNFNVYRKEEQGFAVGDMIRITKNGKSIEAKNLNNGEVHKAIGFDERGNIITGSGKTIPKDYGHLSQGLYRTSFASQGKDAEVLLLSQSSLSFAASNKNQFYVSVSRGAKEVKLYTDDIKELKNAVNTTTDRKSALELIDSDQQKYLKVKAYEELNAKIREQIRESKTKTNEFSRFKDRSITKQVERSEISK